LVYITAEIRLLEIGLGLVARSQKIGFLGKEPKALAAYAMHCWCEVPARVESLSQVLLPFEGSRFLRELLHAECQMRITALAAKKTLARQLVNLPRLRQLEFKRSVNANC
jgi:hypothetical protein